jgi:hypothetical protein
MENIHSIHYTLLNLQVMLILICLKSLSLYALLHTTIMIMINNFIYKDFEIKLC